jgi:hypothetical protein
MSNLVISSKGSVRRRLRLYTAAVTMRIGRIPQIKTTRLSNLGCLLRAVRVPWNHENEVVVRLFSAPDLGIGGGYTVGLPRLLTYICRVHL